MSDDGSDDEWDEFDVGVSFAADDFVLTVRWATDASTDDDTRIAAAGEWFCDTYGFDPSAHARSFSVAPIPQHPAGKT